MEERRKAREQGGRIWCAGWLMWLLWSETTWSEWTPAWPLVKYFWQMKFCSLSKEWFTNLVVLGTRGGSQRCSLQCGQAVRIDRTWKWDKKQLDWLQLPLCHIRAWLYHLMACDWLKFSWYDDWELTSYYKGYTQKLCFQFVYYLVRW